MFQLASTYSATCHQSRTKTPLTERLSTGHGSSQTSGIGDIFSVNLPLIFVIVEIRIANILIISIRPTLIGNLLADSALILSSPKPKHLLCWVIFDQPMQPKLSSPFLIPVMYPDGLPLLLHKEMQ